MRGNAVIRTEAGSTISISSCVSSHCEPDLLFVSVSFSGKRESKADCLASYKKDSMAVKDAFREAGFDPDEIRAAELTITPTFRYVYEKVDDERYEVFFEALWRRNEFSDGFEYDSAASAKYPFSGDMEAVETLWSRLAECGGGISFSIGFGLADEQEATDALVSEAIEQARRRAAMHAVALGYELGDVIHVEADSVEKVLARCARPYGELPESAPLFKPESVEVECRVRIDWQLA